jgi:hypothetical protein
MSRVHVFADEAGNFDFARKSGASKYATWSVGYLLLAGVGRPRSAPLPCLVCTPTPRTASGPRIQ